MAANPLPHLFESILKDNDVLGEYPYPCTFRARVCLKGNTGEGKRPREFKKPRRVEQKHYRLQLTTQTPYQHFSSPDQMSSAQASNNNGGWQYNPYDNPRQPRRVPMACQFCRARKLKCDGLRPQCSNCSRRGVACNYVPVASQTS
ncbi:hypothetical protein R3P38DRAFT_1445677 [Favolaschia claudopus]|uniref:Zn(2)-C6 fungal-type domain-containing protein n=1 Tax=Favolaschia claudopus TaxID=2862362 RepID=A0AAW0ANV0_9AGAR